MKIHPSITFNCVALRRSAPSAAARRLRNLTLFVLAESPLALDELDLLHSKLLYKEWLWVPLTRAFSAGLASTAHLRHSHPFIDDRAQPSGCGQCLTVLDLLRLILGLSTRFVNACLWMQVAAFWTSPDRECWLSSLTFFLLSFGTLLAAGIDSGWVKNTLILALEYSSTFYN